MSVSAGRWDLTSSQLFSPHSMYLAFIESRPIVQGIFAIRFVVGGLCFTELPYIDLWTSMIGQGSWSCMLLGAYLLNGYADLAEDRVNGSVRPLASGQLELSTARIYVVLITSIGLVLATAISVEFLFLAVSVVLLGILYSLGRFPMKNSALGSSLVTSTAGILTYLAGSIAYGAQWSAALFAYSLAMGLWMGVAGSTKDFGDRDGDAFAGRRTLPVALGDKQARFLIAALCMIVGFAALTAVIRYRSPLPLAMLLPASLVVGFLTVSPVLWRRHLRLRLPYQCFMSSQYLVNIAMLVQLGMA